MSTTAESERTAAEEHTAAVTSTEPLAPESLAVERDIEQFLYREARFADQHDYDAWEGIWTDDALYWVPIDGGGYDPNTQMSVIYDNRRRIATRLEQLRTGKRYAQAPPSNMRRTVSNIEFVARDGEGDGSEATVLANFVLMESKERRTRMWVGQNTYVLRQVGDRIRLVRKTVVLINSAEPLPNMGFLI